MEEKKYTIELTERDVAVTLLALAETAKVEFEMYRELKDSSDPIARKGVADAPIRINDLLDIAQKIDPESPLTKAIEKFSDMIMEIDTHDLIKQVEAVMN